MQRGMISSNCALPLETVSRKGVVAVESEMFAIDVLTTGGRGAPSHPHPILIWRMKIIMKIFKLIIFKICL